MGSQISNVDQGGSLSSSFTQESHPATIDGAGDSSAPAELQVETTQVDSSTGKVTNVSLKEERPEENTDAKKTATEPAANATAETEVKEKPKLTEDDVASIDVGELTTQILEMINQEDNESNHSTTELLKKNVELQEFMVKLIELLKEKTNLSANLERQNAALTNQAKSLRDVIAITKDLLNIRNMEVEHLHVDMNAMGKCIKEEREKHNLAVQRVSEAMALNDKLKTEYLTQMELFGKLKDKYTEKVVLLTKENLRLKEQLKGSTATSSVEESIASNENPIGSPQEAVANQGENGNQTENENQGGNQVTSNQETNDVIEPYFIGPAPRDTVKEKNLINAAHSQLIIDTNIIPTEPRSEAE